ncbi:hypothetical protein [Nonomuraea roseola]|uniref:Uncharacterized protein n=1 Tax=Nonomuraea roseola TaxID=46179 RepID=A0ABV5Q418_9ACTN
MVWDLDEDEGFADCPVLLDFEGEQVEINHRKFDALTIFTFMIVRLGGSQGGFRRLMDRVLASRSDLVPYWS